MVVSLGREVRGKDCITIFFAFLSINLEKTIVSASNPIFWVYFLKTVTPVVLVTHNLHFWNLKSCGERPNFSANGKICKDVVKIAISTQHIITTLAK